MAWDHCSRAGLSSLTMKLSPKPSNGMLTETLYPFTNVDLSDSYAKNRDSSSSWQIKTWVNDNNCRLRRFVVAPWFHVTHLQRSQESIVVLVTNYRLEPRKTNDLILHNHRSHTFLPSLYPDRRTSPDHRSSLTRLLILFSTYSSSSQDMGGLSLFHLSPSHLNY